MTNGRRVELGLRLLDHQLVDRDDRMAGNVDDLELTPSEDGTQLYVTAVFAGPGVLWRRLGRRRLGRWLEAAHARVDPDTTTRIPFSRVRDLGPQIRLNVVADELAPHAAEQWARDHVIAHIPGARHEPPSE
jgi:hypothetical protein